MFFRHENNARRMFTDTMRLPKKNTLRLYVPVYYDSHDQQRMCYVTGCWFPLPNNAAYAMSNYGHYLTALLGVSAVLILLLFC
jgi:hypothetical protein